MPLEKKISLDKSGLKVMNLKEGSLLGQWNDNIT